MDLDSVSRTDMLNHITASRPRAPGRRPPTSTSNNKENVSYVYPSLSQRSLSLGKQPNSRYLQEGSNSLLTNGSTPSDGAKLEISPKEKQKQHLPFMDELKVNLKSTKPATDSNSINSVPDKKPFNLWGPKVNTNLATVESSSTSLSSYESNHSKSTSSVELRTSSSAINKSPVDLIRHTVPPKPATAAPPSSASTNLTSTKASEIRHSSATSYSRTEAVSSKISELSSVFDERNKIAPSMTTSDLSHDTSTKKEVNDLKLKVDRLEKTVAELVAQLREEVDKRLKIEKDLLKLTDLVTRV